MVVMDAAARGLRRIGPLEVGGVVPSHEEPPFSPELLATMSAAVEEAWRTLVAAGSSFAADDQAKATQEVLALRIVDTARAGETDPARLTKDALKYLESANARFVRVR
jgi:hypothetical protein